MKPSWILLTKWIALSFVRRIQEGFMNPPDKMNSSFFYTTVSYSPFHSQTCLRLNCVPFRLPHQTVSSLTQIIGFIHLWMDRLTKRLCLFIQYPGAGFSFKGLTAHLGRHRSECRDFPGSPVAKTPCSQCRGAWVSSLLRELDPACRN